jgi:AraC-like DNA-binding protein
VALAEQGRQHLSGPVGQGLAIHDSVELSRLVLGMAATRGADGRALARDAGLPTWLLGVDQAMIASSHHTRLWELAEHALQDPYLGLAAVNHHRVGDLDLYDYLFTTAATVREAQDVTGSFFHLASTNCSLRPETDAGANVTYSYRHALPGGRGEELWTQFSIAGFCARIAAAAGRRIVPVGVTFTQSAPRSYQAFIDMFGTRRIEFGAPVTTFTLRAEDLDMPMPGADPVLARILRRYAATLPRPASVDWLDLFLQALAEVIGEGAPSLDTLSRRLAVSTRSLQRRLAEYGTSWRAELESARRHRAQRAFQNGTGSLNRLPHQLGYADPRSVRRALRRWDTQQGPETQGSPLPQP